LTILFQHTKLPIHLTFHVNRTGETSVVIWANRTDFKESVLVEVHIIIHFKHIFTVRSNCFSISDHHKVAGGFFGYLQPSHPHGVARFRGRRVMLEQFYQNNIKSQT